MRSRELRADRGGRAREPDIRGGGRGEEAHALARHCHSPDGRRHGSIEFCVWKAAVIAPAVVAAATATATAAAAATLALHPRELILLVAARGTATEEG